MSLTRPLALTSVESASAMGGAAVEQRRGQVRQPGFGAVAGFAGANQQAEGDGGLAVVFDDENLQTVGQGRGLVIGEAGGGLRAGCRWVRAVDVGVEGGGGGQEQAEGGNGT
jgi:hypothetical protein